MKHSGKGKRHVLARQGVDLAVFSRSVPFDWQCCKHMSGYTSSTVIMQ